MATGDTSTYLNLPGLVYLNDGSTNWETDSSCFLNYTGLKYMSGSNDYNFAAADMLFLNYWGLQYFYNTKVVPMLKSMKNAAD